MGDSNESTRDSSNPYKGAAQVCYRFLQICLADAKLIVDVLELYCKKKKLGILSLSMTVSKCQNILARIFVHPVLLETFLHDTGFQGWGLVLFELLALLKWKVEYSSLHGILDLTLKGPRLRVLFDRLESMISQHLEYLKPSLRALDFDMLEIQKTKGRDAYVQEIRNLLSLNGGVLKIEHLIEDEEGCEWWIEQFGMTTYAIPWAKFEAQLKTHKDPKIVKLFSSSKGFMDMVKETVSPHHSRKAVTVFEFGQFLFSYGPGIRVALLQMVASSRSATWFGGALTYDEAKSILSPCRLGTFLVRFSESAPCTWAVSYANEATGQINHALVKARSSAKGDNDQFICGDQVYKSLGDLVKRNGAQLRYPAPHVKNLGPARCFRDFLTFEEAADMLEGKPVGTFLIRFSQSQEACLVVAYVTESKGVLQSKIFCDPEKGFILGGKPYKRIPNLVRQNRDKLQFPLASQGGFDMSRIRDDDEESRDDDYDETILALEDHSLLMQKRQRRQQQLQGGGDDDPYGHIYGSLLDHIPHQSSYLPLGSAYSALGHFDDDIADDASTSFYDAIPSAEYVGLPSAKQASGSSNQSSGAANKSTPVIYGPIP